MSTEIKEADPRGFEDLKMRFGKTAESFRAHLGQKDFIPSAGGRNFGRDFLYITQLYERLIRQGVINQSDSNELSAVGKDIADMDDIMSRNTGGSHNSNFYEALAQKLTSVYKILLLNSVEKYNSKVNADRQYSLRFYIHANDPDDQSSSSRNYFEVCKKMGDFLQYAKADLLSSSVKAEDVDNVSEILRNTDVTGSSSVEYVKGKYVRNPTYYMAWVREQPFLK